ncbi:hypothetical protein RUM44_003048 [Polyplax serrata]|uniref:CDT1 Geminin-binding domain-containing protein n=1 Tax=Polyplax serrata TaxID=468196 RepID=A0ABR1AXE4_POLSC
MSVQPSIACFFGKRKRLVADNGFKSKLLRTDPHSSVQTTKAEALISSDVSEAVAPTERHEINKIISDGKTRIKSGASTRSQGNNEKSKSQMDIRESMRKCQEKGRSAALNSPVKFQLLGSLSPTKKSSLRNKFNKDWENVSVLNVENSEVKTTEEREDNTVREETNPSIRNLNFSDNKDANSTEDIIQSAKELVLKIKEKQRKLTSEGPKKKELSFKEIKDKINRSSKLNELKKSINKINQHAEQLIELEKSKLTGTQPKLSKFNSFEIIVPASPVKQSRSPVKPAYKRFAGLADTTTSLPLPFGYQRLYEFFCAADTICSMITNRGEVLTFNKLKPAVEEMTRKTFTTRHLGQIAAVYPEAFTFNQEKLRNYGSTSKVDKYELVITPTIPRNPDAVQFTKEPSKDDDVFRCAERRIMTPKVLKARKDIFYKNLFEKTKDYHEEFLKTLDPPIVINRDDLKRWHPSFMVDFVPDVTPQEVPQAPNSEGPATAKQVLDRARDFLSSNVRLQKALEAAAGEETTPVENPKPEVPPEIKAKVDARLKDPLKGISKSLLEKVRAKQAAKALDVMRMTPEQEKETIMYMRLPDMARIVRTAFVNEQKGVLPMEHLLEKVQFSCNRNLGLSEVENHIQLLTKLLPEWLSVVTLRNLNFLKINRSVDATTVMTKLKKIVDEKKGGK